VVISQWSVVQVSAKTVVCGNFRVVCGKTECKKIMWSVVISHWSVVVCKQFLVSDVRKIGGEGYVQNRGLHRLHWWLLD